MFNFKKDTLQNEFGLSDIDHIEEASEGGTSRGDHKLEVTIHFKQTHPYYLRAQSLDQYHTLVQVLRHVVRASQSGNISARARAASPTRIAIARVHPLTRATTWQPTSRLAFGSMTPTCRRPR